MTSSTLPHASPALSELLLDLDKRPRTKLFGLSPAQVIRGMRGNITPVGKRQAGLDSLERHLLDVHRDELAHLLTQQALFQMMNTRGLSEFCSSWTRADRAVEVIAVKNSRVALLESIPTRIERETVRAGGIEELFSNGSSQILAFLACHVSATPHRRVVLGTTQVFAREHQSGLASLCKVLSGPMRIDSKRCAAQNAAVSAWRLGDLALALELIAEATRGKAVPPAMWLDHLLLAVRSMDSVKTRVAAEGVAECLGTEHPAFAEGVRTTRALMGADGGMPDQNVVNFAKEQCSALPESGREFLEETFCRGFQVESGQ